MEENRHHQFFQNRECKYFPCHKGIDEADFNCLFCYCPLYALGKKCGGNCRYNDKGNKVCTDCTFPHHKDNYSKVIARYPDIMLTVHRNDQEEECRRLKEPQEISCAGVGISGQKECL